MMKGGKCAYYFFCWQALIFNNRIFVYNRIKWIVVKDVRNSVEISIFLK